MKNLLIFFIFSILHAQWFEGNLYLPDSFSGTCGTDQMIWNSIDDRIYLRGFNETFVVINGQTDEKVEPIRINNANEKSRPGWFEWNQGNNHLYIWFHPYNAFFDSLHVIDCQTHQTVNIISFPRNRFTYSNQAQMCASPVSNKVYLIKENNQAGSDIDTLIYVIDGNSHQVIKTIKFVVASTFSDYYPSLKWNPVNNCIYLMGYHPDTDSIGIAVIDCEIDSIITIIPLSPLDLNDNCFGLDTLRNKLYLSINDTIGTSTAILEIDCFTNSIVQRIDIYNAYYDKIEFILNPENQKIFYSNLRSGFVYIIDIISGIVEDSILVFSNIYSGMHLELYQPNNEIYCVNKSDMPDSLAVIDLRSGLINYYGLPDEYGVGFRPFLHFQRGKLYLSRGYGEAIVIFDCTSHAVRRTIYNGTQQANDILINPIEHKLYCTNNYRPFIFVFDSETKQALHQVQVAPKGYGLVRFGFAPPHNKIYISYPGHIIVLDSRTDSVIKTISGLISYCDFAYNIIEDKLYTLNVSSGNGSEISYIIDCSADSVIKILETTWAGLQTWGDIEFDSLTNKVYMTGTKFVVIDCQNDSVLKRDSTLKSGDIHFRTHGDNRVYAGNAMIDRFNNTLIGTLPFTFPLSEYNAINDRIYIADGQVNRNKIYVVDCRTNMILDSISVAQNCIIRGMFWNYLNNKLYFDIEDTTILQKPVLVADCRSNEIIANFPQISPAGLRFKRCLDHSNNRFYVHAYRGSKLGIIRDNINDIDEIEKKRGELKIYPTLGKKFFIETNEMSEIKIYNTLGEKVAEFSSDNKNIISWDAINKKGKKLNKGVYFIITALKKKIVKKLILF